MYMLIHTLKKSSNFQFSILCILLLLSSFKLLAQNNNSSDISLLKTNQLSDQQIIQLWQQAQKSGLSESDAMNLLVRKGLNPAEVTNFKKRLVQLQSANKNKFSTQAIIKDSIGFLRDSSWVIEVPNVKRKSIFYGFDFFSNPTISFEPNIRIATPKNYILGPDDELSISLTGLNETNIDVKIDPQGNIQIPYTGIINISGLSIEQAIQRIKSRMKMVYPALTTGKTTLLASLSNVKSIRIAIIGEAERPGNYQVSALSSFFNVLYLSGGPSQNGSLRKIEIIRHNKMIETVDFYSFLQKGLLNKDITLQDQDIIHFPVYEKRVYIAGEVKRPAVYELTDKETLQDLLQYAGGWGDSAAKETIRVIQTTDKEKRIKDFAFADLGNYIPHNADSIHIDKILPVYANKVTIAGAVYNPGIYELTPELNLSQLLHKAGGIIKDAAVEKGYIKRIVNGSLRELITFNTNNNTLKQQDILLAKDDSVLLIAKDSIQDIATISISGSVRKPGNFQYRKGTTLEDLILLAGGFSNDADTRKIQISRLEKNKADTLANTLIHVITASVDSSLNSDAATPLIEPYDYIFVPQLLNYHSLGKIKIRGEVLYPGDYEVEKRNETVQEILQRAGGISPFASMNDVQIYRKNLRVSNNLMPENSIAGKNAFLLLPDDSIYVPRSNPFVEVKGAVFTPQILNYQSAGFYQYISAAGGATDKADLRRAYVQYSNGLNRKTRYFLFFRNYPPIEPGSKIIIPEADPNRKKGPSIVELSAVTGILTALIAMAQILRL